MTFYDRNGAALYVGDHIKPDEGRELLLISEAYVEDFWETCLFGQQVADPRAFSILTQEDLSNNWDKVESDEISTTEAMEIILGGSES